MRVHRDEPAAFPAADRRGLARRPDRQALLVEHPPPRGAVVAHHSADRQRDVVVEINKAEPGRSRDAPGPVRTRPRPPARRRAGMSGPATPRRHARRRAGRGRRGDAALPGVTSNIPTGSTNPSAGPGGRIRSPWPSSTSTLNPGTSRRMRSSARADGRMQVDLAKAVHSEVASLQPEHRATGHGLLRPGCTSRKELTVYYRIARPRRKDNVTNAPPPPPGHAGHTEKRAAEWSAAVSAFLRRRRRGREGRGCLGKLGFATSHRLSRMSAVPLGRAPVRGPQANAEDSIL